ncbi:50S ribosomal protein L1 [bacterium]|nr:50S ribosomal protein L1 [bacterium]
MKRGKKYNGFRDKLEPLKEYTLSEAFELLKDNTYTKFDETVEIAIRLGVDPRYSNQMIRGAAVLPKGTGKESKILVIAEGEKVKEAEEAGADWVGKDEYIEKINGGWLDFDILIATPDTMKDVGKLGKVLGPRGLMPSPKTGTVTFDLKDAIEDAKAGKVQYKVDKNGNIHALLGKVSFVKEDLLENAKFFIDTIIRAKPAGVKGQYIRNVTISSTMSPGFKINLSSLTE